MECILEHLETQGSEISANHGGAKAKGELQHVTGLPKKTEDTSLASESGVAWKPLINT